MAHRRDQYLRCEECGTEFVYTLEEQRRAEAAGSGPATPRACPGCRVLARRLRDRLWAGRVRWFDRRKGFGFLMAEDGAALFVHRTGLAEGVQTLRNAQAVLFRAREGAKGREAFDVRPADVPAPDADD